MKDAVSYWSPLCGLVMQLRCWARVAWREDDATQEGWWGTLLIMPVESYLEGCEGPTPVRDVEWVEVSTNRVKGGLRGLPLEMVNVKDEILAGLVGTQLCWELRETTWSMDRIFQDEPVQVLRFMNPFGPIPRT